jgi:glycosyltransferase involved in cell wall biosynthesis
MADGYVHPSRWDSHSLALVENLALGVPTLVSNVIHVAPELEAAHAAVLAAPRSETLARGLQVLAEHGAAVLGRHAREYIRKRLNWRTVVPDYLDALARLGLTCLSGMTAL